MDNINAYDIDFIVVGRRIDLTALLTETASIANTRRYRDALHIGMGDQHMFVFDYGVVICWKVDEDKRFELLEYVKACTIRKIVGKSWERIPFIVDNNSAVNVRDDRISVPDTEVFTLLSVSHALAQSAQLEQFEIVAEKTVTDQAYLSETLAQTGKIPLSRKSVAKLRGALFQTKSDIILHFNLLDTPEFFWEHPEQESHYLPIAKYYELRPRVELLTLKLETISELLEMLATEQNHKHSAFLEWVIIVLIAVDIIVYFGH